MKTSSMDVVCARATDAGCARPAVAVGGNVRTLNTPKAGREGTAEAARGRQGLQPVIDAIQEIITRASCACWGKRGQQVRRRKQGRRTRCATCRRWPDVTRVRHSSPSSSPLSFSIRPALLGGTVEVDVFVRQMRNLRTRHTVVYRIEVRSIVHRRQVWQD